MDNRWEPRFLMQQYGELRPLYDEFARTAADLLGTLLNAAQLRVHSITCRAKDPVSLLRKLEATPGKYEKLADVTDLAGVRIVTYFPDEVDLVAAVVRKELDIDWEHSIDKRQLFDPDRFGYLSLHYVATLSSQRTGLTEYRRFDRCRLEVQLRSILQHTWAEIEHDLGCKTAQVIPRELRRRFSRLARSIGTSGCRVRPSTRRAVAL